MQFILIKIAISQLDLTVILHYKQKSLTRWAGILKPLAKNTSPWEEFSLEISISAPAIIHRLYSNLKLTSAISSLCCNYFKAWF